MTTILKIPPRTVHLKKNFNKKYTIHFDNSYIFTIQKNNGTSILSFRKYDDIIKFSKLLENYYELNEHWPMVNFEDTFVYKVNKSSKLRYLEVKEWKDTDLKYFCINYAFNMLDILTFDENTLKGNNVTWDVPLNCYIDMLNEKLLIK